MFTGIIGAVGTVASIARQPDRTRLTIEARSLAASIAPGESICVSGVCLTVVSNARGSFDAELVPETLGRTSLGQLVPGARVNLERCVRMQDRLGGHLVSGHVDGVGAVTGRFPEGEGVRLVIEMPAELRRYLVPKGSVCVDGVSLTVAAVSAGAFEVALIPYTLSHTTFETCVAGTKVNLEADLIAKYVEGLIKEGGVELFGGQEFALEMLQRLRGDH